MSENGKVKISQIKPNPNNPRILKDDKFKKLVQSIKDFPQMLEKRPLVCFTDTDRKLVVLGGNMRLRACQEVGLKEIPVALCDDWTAEQKREFIIKDNIGYGEWDYSALANEWDYHTLDQWGLTIPNFDMNEKNIENEFEKEIPNDFFILKINFNSEGDLQKVYNELKEIYKCEIIM